MLEAYLEILELAYFEVTEAFKDLADENVWKRPAEGLLSVGELAGHVAHWEAVRFAGDGGESRDLSTCKITSPLIDSRFRYYTSSLDVTLTDEQLSMTAQQVCDELLRVHKEAVASVRELNPDMTSPVNQYPAQQTWGDYVKYLVFHVSYHTGQMYSVRHLLGEETPDN